MMRLTVLSLLISISFASPVEFDSQQTILAPPSNDEDNSVGWVDPRLNGGRLLDVRADTFGNVRVDVDIL